MKKLSFIVAMALAVVANYSCGEYDNSVEYSGKTTITDANGNPYQVGPVATLKANAGDQVTVGIQVYDGEDYYALKSGENIVTAQVNDQEVVTLSPITVADDGVIEVLGNNNIHTLTLNKAFISNIDKTKITDLVALEISDVEVESIELLKYEKLEKLTMVNCGLKNIVLDDVSNLEKLDLNTNNLTTINLKKCYNLETVDLSNNALTNVDLANDYTKLTAFFAPHNQLTSFDATKMRNVKTLDLQDNQLQGEINLAVCSDLETAYLQDNELTAVKASKVATELNIANNKLGFDSMPLVGSIDGNYIYAPQKDLDVIVANGILDLSAQYMIDGNLTTFVFDPEETEIDALENGRFAFINAVNNVVVSMTNDAFPGLTLKTVPITSEAASNIIYSFIPETDANATGGEIIYEHTTTGTAADEIDYLHYKYEYKANNFYTTILLNGTKESVANLPYHYVRVNLDEPLKKGNVLRFTGYRFTPTSEHASLYLLFDLLNNNSERTYLDYFPGSYKTFEYNGQLMFSNIWFNGLTPNELTLTVDEAMAGSKSFKISRNVADTDIYLTKIEILRKAE